MTEELQKTQEVTVASDNEANLSQRATQLIEGVNRAVIDSDETLNKGIDITKMLKDHLKHVDSERRLIVDPLNHVVKHVNGRFRDITDPLKKAEGIIKGKILTFQREQEAQRRREAEERQKALEAEELEKAAKLETEGDKVNAEVAMDRMERTTVKPVEAPKASGTMTGASSSITKKWKPRIVDVSALAKAYPDTVTVKESAIMALFRAGIKEIPGVEFYQDESISIR